jgi:hypothetical protein
MYTETLSKASILADSSVSIPVVFTSAVALDELYDSGAYWGDFFEVILRNAFNGSCGDVQHRGIIFSPADCVAAAALRLGFSFPSAY